MEISDDTINYLKSIENKVTDYAESRIEAIDFLMSRKVTSESIICALVIGSLIWTADKRCETITEDEILMYLGSEKAFDFDTDDFLLVTPEKGIGDLPLSTFLEMILKNYT